jgi:hypothetical protein
MQLIGKTTMKTIVKAMTWRKDVLKAHQPTTIKWLEHCSLDEVLCNYFQIT